MLVVVVQTSVYPASQVSAANSAALAVFTNGSLKPERSMAYALMVSWSRAMLPALTAMVELTEVPEAVAVAKGPPPAVL